MPGAVIGLLAGILVGLLCGALLWRKDACRYGWLRFAQFLSSPTPVVVQGVYEDGKWVRDEAVMDLDEALNKAFKAAGRTPYSIKFFWRS